MHKIIVSVFDSEPAAFQGVTALKELHNEGDITLYATSVVKKAENGWVSVLQSDDNGPVGTLTGLVGGSLVGLLGGPIGVAIGAYAGTMGGALFDCSTPASAWTSSTRSPPRWRRARSRSSPTPTRPG